jgi:hypothetical protein
LYLRDAHPTELARTLDTLEAVRSASLSRREIAGENAEEHAPERPRARPLPCARFVLHH